MSLRVLPEGGLPPAQRTGLIDYPFTEISTSLAVARCLGVSARLGLLAELANRTSRVEALAARFGLDIVPLRLMLDLLVAENYLYLEGGEYSLAPGARAWLDPESPTSVTTTLAYSLQYWDRWTELDQIAAGGATVPTRPDPNDDAGWSRRVRAEFEFERSIGEDFADVIDLRWPAQSIVELGTAHAAYSMALCRRSPMLRSTVIDEPAATAIGRELAWESSMDRVITHRDGDIFTADLGGPHDAVICRPLAGGLDHDQACTLLRRLRTALQPGGLLITLRPSSDGAPEASVNSSWYRLFMRLAARVDPCSEQQFCEQLRSSGFGPPRTHPLRSVPELSVYVARAV